MLGARPGRIAADFTPPHRIGLFGFATLRTISVSEKFPYLCSRVFQVFDGSFDSPYAMAGWFNRRRFVAESRPRCSTGHGLTLGENSKRPEHAPEHFPTLRANRPRPPYNVKQLKHLHYTAASAALFYTNRSKRCRSCMLWAICRPRSRETGTITSVAQRGA